MRGGDQAECRSQQHNAGTPLAAWSLHGMGDTDGGIDGGEEAESGKDFGIRREPAADDRRSHTIERERDVTAGVAIETPRHPPQRPAQQHSGKGKRQTQQQADEAEFVAHLPGGGLRRLPASTRSTVSGRPARRYASAPS